VGNSRAATSTSFLPLPPRRGLGGAVDVIEHHIA